ncbi:MAG TPA: cytochrome c [Steroidobacteraceae bacterium]|jgi:mono/diheme cytochrome c family protein
MQAMLKWMGVLTAGALASTGVLAADQSGDAAARNQMLQRGEYIARAAACLSCHTQAGGKAFAGGAALKTPFGTLYAPNITPAKTGIAGWEEQDFERAVRVGVRKDGTLLYPGMPYTAYAHMSRDDMYALWSYLRLLDPVSSSVPQDALIFPFNLRGGLAVWQSYYYRPAPFSPLPNKSAAWNRGHYLVAALGHCDSCHVGGGASGSAAGADTPHRLSPAQLSGWFVSEPATDPLAVLPGWKVQQVADYLKTGQPPADSAGAIRAHEPGQMHDSLSHLTDDDRLAMATYLQDPLKPAAPSHEVTTTSDENLREGKLLYGRSCIGCHGANGQGRAGVGSLTGNPALTVRAPYRINLAMLDGVPAHGKVATMPGFARSLDDQQIADLSNYVRTAWGNRAEPNATPWAVGSWRLLTQPVAAANNAAGATPAAGTSLACPTLDDAVLKPALAVDARAKPAAARNGPQVQALVEGYLRQRPQSSGAEVIDALSVAYCRSSEHNGQSPALRTGAVADYAQQIAIVLTH